ncbi:GNAT family N-acyltransferase [Marivita sp. S2033]|uniref:GNAT family N-acyltransferase n=1 Tax=Marivita sp. S2033 TaxID=3373187 RepID=UPI00398241CA
MSATAAMHRASADAFDLTLGGYRATVGTGRDVTQNALALRSRAFRRGMCDRDRYDRDCLHGVVVGPNSTPSVAFRVRLLDSPAQILACYTGQFYGLSPLCTQTGPLLELGRFCQAAGSTDIMALRLAWAAIAAVVDRSNARMLIGCTALPGAQADRHTATLATLAAHHVGPRALLPQRISPLALDLPRERTDAPMPPLLRSYLNMGGWVSDHAVRDPDLDTIHVFTGLSVCAIPATRQRRLRALARCAASHPLDLGRTAP